MKSFSSYLVESKNTHMEHIEDMVFNDGVTGARLAINSLRQLRDMLAGNASQDLACQDGHEAAWCVCDDPLVPSPFQP